jgi:hypothetical protein
MKSAFSIKRITLAQKGFSYVTFQLTGYLHSQRIRKQFKSQEEALGEKNRLEVAAANDGSINSVLTRLTVEQVALAEAAYRRLGDKPLALPVEWFLETYRPPVVEKAFSDAVVAFLGQHSDGVFVFSIARRTPSTSRVLARDRAR